VSCAESRGGELVVGFSLAFLWRTNGVKIARNCKNATGEEIAVDYQSTTQQVQMRRLKDAKRTTNAGGREIEMSINLSWFLDRHSLEIMKNS